jgi:hypothetical protein
MELQENWMFMKAMSIYGKVWLEVDVDLEGFIHIVLFFQASFF